MLEATAPPPPPLPPSGLVGSLPKERVIPVHEVYVDNIQGRDCRGAATHRGREKW